MAYSDSLYDYDRTHISDEAKLNTGAYLYRLTSITHAGIDDALNGGGPLNSPQYGRFNVPNQRTTYCANNIILCMAEILYHMYRTSLIRIEECAPTSLIRASFKATRALMILRVNAIADLVYLDGSDIKINFSEPRMGGTATVHPWPNYEKDTLISKFNNNLRHKGKKGVFYPSARSSRDLCIALFYDETSKIDRSSFQVLQVDLQLLAEHQPLASPILACDPFIDKLHPTMGYYAFSNCTKLRALDVAGHINPANIPDKGIVDFVRRQYQAYPTDAVYP